MIYHAEPVRLRRRHPIAGEEKFLRFARPKFPWVREIFDSSYSKTDGMVDELSVFAGNNYVAWPDQHQATHDAPALNRRNRRFGDIAPALAQADIELLLARHLRLSSGAGEAAPGANRL